MSGLQTNSCLTTSNCYIVNATTWLGPLYLIQPLYGVIVPILTIITIISNTMIIIVLTRYLLLTY